MCGIAGFFVPGGFPADSERQDIARMASAIDYRGPDDEGAWSDPASGVAFCHRRLSIVDLSPLGHQPMSSPTGRFTITFNGEIYNFHALRDELRKLGFSFRGGS